MHWVLLHIVERETHEMYIANMADRVRGGGHMADTSVTIEHVLLVST